MAEWLYEAGIGEARAALIEDGVIIEARIEGSGAGMDPPDGARLIGGFWRWHPALPPLKEVVMRRSGATADWRVCTASGCRAMGDYLPADADPVTLKICD